jgi:hypothetical protein
MRKDYETLGRIGLMEASFVTFTDYLTKQKTSYVYFEYVSASMRSTYGIIQKNELEHVLNFIKQAKTASKNNSNYVEIVLNLKDGTYFKCRPAYKSTSWLTFVQWNTPEARMTIISDKQLDKIAAILETAKNKF